MADASAVRKGGRPITYTSPMTRGVDLVFVPSGTLTYTQIGTWGWSDPGIPPGVDMLMEAVGGGGGGGHQVTGAHGGGGGGGGGYAAGVADSAMIALGGSVTIGDGGTSGQPGAASNMYLDILRISGHRGETGGEDGAAGTGGTGFTDGSLTSPVDVTGDDGGASTTANGAAGGDSFAGGVGGAGGVGVAGSDGTVPGGGGGGGGHSKAGGHGGAGLVRITWPPP